MSYPAAAIFFARRRESRLLKQDDIYHCYRHRMMRAAVHRYWLTGHTAAAADDANHVHTLCSYRQNMIIADDNNAKSSREIARWV